MAYVRSRSELLDEVLSDLHDLKKKGYENIYAVDENIAFFEAMRSRRAFFAWLIKRMPRIDGTKLLELSDFGLHGGKWESILQQELLALEKKSFPDVLRMLRQAILKTIEELPASDAPIVLASVGSGTMEIDRQIVATLRKNPMQRRIIFFGIDNSEASINAAVANLSSEQAPIKRVELLTPDMLVRLVEDFKNQPYAFILFKGDALKIDEYFPPKAVDIFFHTRFKHHLPKNLHNQLDALLTKTAKHVIEHDDLNGWFLPLFSSFANWGKPILMNGAIFSSLRDPKKHELKRDKRFYKIKITPAGYVRELHVLSS